MTARRFHPRRWVWTVALVLAVTGCGGLGGRPPAPADAPAADLTAATAGPSAAPATPLPPTPTLAATAPAATATSAPPPAPPLALTERWTHTAGAPIAGLTVFSMDGGPLPDLIAAAADGRVYPISLNNRLYPQGALDTPLTAVAAANLDDEPLAEVVAGGADGRVAVFDTGALVWEYEAGAPVTALLAAKPDGAAVVVGTDGGRVIGLGADGVERWMVDLGAPVSALVAAGPDVMAAAGARLVVLRDGAAAAEFDAGGPFALTVADLDGETAAILGTAGGEVIRWDPAGGERWRQPTGGPVRALAVAPGNVAPIVVLGGPRGDTLMAFGADGQSAARVALDAPATALAVADLDGDGAAEWLAAGPAGLAVLTPLGGRRGDAAVAGAVAGLRVVDMDQSQASPHREIVVWGEDRVLFFDVADGNAAAVPETTPAPDAALAPAATNVPDTDPTSTHVAFPDDGLPVYRLDVALDYAGHTLDVAQTVELVNGSADEWTEVVFNVSAAYWELFDLSRAAATVGGRTAEVEPVWEGTMLRAPLPAPLPPGGRATLAFDYALTLPRLDPYGWGPAGNAGWSPEVTQVGDWYPALVPYDDGAGWRTWRYHPVGDPVISGLGHYEVAIRAPAGVTLAAAGPLGEEEDARRFRLERARSFAFLASRDYRRFEGEAGGVPVRVYTLARHGDAGPAVVAAAEQAIMLFTEQFGPYPYGEFVLAENGFLTAIEYSVVVSQSGFAFDSYTGSADSLLIAIVAHEAAHQWWYGAVGNDQVNEPWLDEALCMMSELLFYERYYPELVDWWWQFRVDRWNPAGSVDVTVYEFDSSEAFVHNMYGMGARFLWDLRETMGTEAFGAALRDYYAAHRDGFATGEAFFAAMARHTAADLAGVRGEYFRE